jgi:carbon storage regulator
MLVLKRKQGQAIDVGDNIRIILQKVKGNQVKIGIVAPRDVRVKRSEIVECISRVNRLAAQTCPDLDESGCRVMDITCCAVEDEGEQGDD